VDEVIKVFLRRRRRKAQPATASTAAPQVTVGAY
jgi:hypothetical protein